MKNLSLQTLNEAQQQAVTAPLGHLLILAGAGSGKTRVLVHRIAWLVESQWASPHGLLAVTFTNKAAGEIRGRLESMLGREVRSMWVGTFHGLAHKLLRLHWKEAGLIEHFQVMDSDDQLQILRRLFKTLNINEERFEPRKAQGFINRKKDEGIRALQLQVAEGAYEEVMSSVYRQYETYCHENGVVDFAELLLRSYELLSNHEELCSYYQARFSHILVDEFQDTNTIQYQWMCLLAKQSKSVTVVGDDDQSIYGWRGAKIENIHRFEREFKETQLIRLEQNYRSTHTILSAANALISHNTSRMGKTLWTAGEKGEPVSVYGGFNEEDEALYVVRQIRAWLDKDGHLQDVGVLYRSNAQSRVLEEALVRAGIPYSIYGGLRFFERAEIKDALAYLKLFINPLDNAALERVINVPPRGIGEKSLEKLTDIVNEKNCSYWEAIQSALAENLISGKARSGLQAFVEVIEPWINCALQTPLSKLMDAAIQKSGLLRFFKEQKGEKAQNRVENLEELINAICDFEEQCSEEEHPVTAFLAYASLEGGERYQKEEQKGIQLMTLHSAKGLEFPLVFVCGLEDGLFPHLFSRDNKESLEEERRLCYVGITRAMQQLHLTYAEKRRVFGRDEERRKSRFISEIPEHLLIETSRRINIRSSYGAYSSVSQYSQLEPDFEGSSAFCLGQRVSHAKFGEGTIVDHEGQGERARVHVHFDRHGSKWLALAYAKLEEVV